MNKKLNIHVTCLFSTVKYYICQIILILEKKKKKENNIKTFKTKISIFSFINYKGKSNILTIFILHTVSFPTIHGQNLKFFDIVNAHCSQIEQRGKGHARPKIQPPICQYSVYVLKAGIMLQCGSSHGVIVANDYSNFGMHK